MKEIKRVTLLNTISALLLQIFTIISGFIIPKIILMYFGSETNGLVASLNQFLSYISLIEGGITGVIMANLYKPLYERDNEKISSIIKTTNKFFYKIALIFSIYAIILAIVYPIIFNTGFSYLYVFLLTLVLSLNLLIQYSLSLTLKLLLNADKKNYIVSFTQILIIICNIVLAILSVKIYPSIHFLKFISGLIYLLQPLLYARYIKKHYIIDKNAKVNNQLLKSRWDGFSVNIAAMIHFNTDIAILTIFTDLTVVSVYSVYSLVTYGLRQLINAISTGIAPTIGQAYAKGDNNELNKKFDIYEYIIFVLVFLLFSVAGMLITPFIMIYTKNINDANYYQPLFGVLLVISEALYLIKFSHLDLVYSANKFKEIRTPCYIEAGLNIIVSVILVTKLGLIGVAIGTIVGMIYRMVFHVGFTKKHLIKNRSQWNFYGKFISFSIVAFIGIFVCIRFIPIIEYSIISWIFHGIIYFLIMSMLYFIMSIILYKDKIKYIKEYIKKG